MIHVVICDDEKYMLDQIRKQVSDFFSDKNIENKITLLSSGEALLQYNKPIDILFLDIQMDGIDGIEAARMLRSQGFAGFLIFITVLKEMVFETFEVQAYDYLVKPLKKSALEKMMRRLLSSLENAREAKLLVKRGNESIIVSFDDIVFCEVVNRKLYLHLKSKEVIDYYDRIEHLEAKLGSSFFRCHRSYLVHLKYLRGYKDGMAYMADGKRIPVSRLRSKAFSDIILSYMKNGLR